MPIGGFHAWRSPRRCYRPARISRASLLLIALGCAAAAWGAALALGPGR